jgi:hypothetical protein
MMAHDSYYHLAVPIRATDPQAMLPLSGGLALRKTPERNLMAPYLTQRGRRTI